VAFICEPCAKKAGVEPLGFRSVGPCEDCGSVASCADIPGRYLKKAYVKDGFSRDKWTGNKEACGISQYTAQSADQDVERASIKLSSGDVDVRGNPSFPARGVPTQEEADAIKGEL
jgi:hypothetical protein